MEKMEQAKLKLRKRRTVTQPYFHNDTIDLVRRFYREAFDKSRLLKGSYYFPIDNWFGENPVTRGDVLKTLQEFFTLLPSGLGWYTKKGVQFPEESEFVERFKFNATERKRVKWQKKQPKPTTVEPETPTEKVKEELRPLPTPEQVLQEHLEEQRTVERKKIERDTAFQSRVIFLLTNIENALIELNKQWR